MHRSSSCAARKPLRWRRLGEADRTVARLSRREGFAAGVSDGLMHRRHGARRSPGCSGSLPPPAPTATIDGVLVATLALLCLASFDAVTPLPQAARELSATLAAGRRVLEIADREARVRDPVAAPPAPVVAVRRSPSKTFTAHYPAADRLVLHGVSLTLARRAQGRARRAQRIRQDDRSPISCSASSTRSRVASRSIGATCATTGRRTFAARLPSRGRTPTCSPPRSERTSALQGPTRRRPIFGTRFGAHASGTGSRRCRTASTRFVGEEGDLALRRPAPAHRPRSCAPGGGPGPHPRRAGGPSRRR